MVLHTHMTSVFVLFTINDKAFVNVVGNQSKICSNMVKCLLSGLILNSRADRYGYKFDCNYFSISETLNQMYS